MAASSAHPIRRRFGRPSNKWLQRRPPPPPRPAPARPDGAEMSTVALRRAEAGPIAAATRDRALLHEFLERDRLFAAYAICDLDDREFPRTRWALARQGDDVVAIGVEYEGSSPQPLFVMG